MAIEAPPMAPPPAGLKIEGNNGPPPPAPAPKGEIRASEIVGARENFIPSDRKPTAAKTRLQDRIVKGSKVEGAPQPNPAAPLAERKQPEPGKAGGEAPSGNGEVDNEPPQPAPGDDPAAAVAADPNAAPDPSGKKPKANPWKLVEEYKGKLAAAEKQVLETKSSILPEQDRTQMTARVEAAEKRAKELEDHIRFVDYSKSQEFVEKYDKPYKQAWARATKELREIPVTDPETGVKRAATEQDLLALCNLPLADARALSDSIFGVFSGDVMAHRKEVMQRFEEQNQALNDAKANGETRTKQQQEAWQKQAKDMHDSVIKNWTEATQAAAKDPKHGKYFSEHEGDEDWNTALKKGYELADKAFSLNPLDPKLSPEQRAEVVRFHAAVRNRAAAFGPLRKQVEKLESKLAEYEKELAQFKGTTPQAGGSRPAPAGQTPANGMERLQQKLSSMVH